MKNKNGIVGAFVVAGLLLFTAGLFLIGDRHQAFSHHVEYYADFVNLAGLSKGSKVRVAGVDAGQVVGIDIPESPSSRFRVALRIDERLRGLVRTDSLATIGTEGVVGNVFLSIRSGSSLAPSAGPLTTLPTTEPLEISDVISKGTGLLDDTDGAIKLVSGKLDGALDDMKTTVLNVNDVVVGLKAGRGTAGMLLRDQSLAANLRETLKTTTSNVNEIVSDLKGGRGAAGLLLRDQAIAGKIQGTVSDLNHASGQADALLSNLQSRDISGKLDQLITNAKNAAAHADESALQIHQILSEIAVPDEQGTTPGTNIRESLTNINTSTENLADDTEALKHNFLLRGFFRRRGYYNVNHLSADRYRKDPFFTSPHNLRTWLSGPELFQNTSNGMEELSVHGKSVLDSALAHYDNPPDRSPIVVEGYWGDDDPTDQTALARGRAILVKQYLKTHLHIDSDDIGIVLMKNSPPSGLGRATWDGICIVLARKAAPSSS